MNYNMDAINEHRAYISELRQQLDAANARIVELESLCRTMQNLSDVHGLLHGNALARIAELEAALRKAHQLKCYIGNPSAWQNYDESVSEAIREAVNITGKAQ